MSRTERHIFVNSKNLDDLCFNCKNLYNKANYVVRQEFISTSKLKEEGKLKHANWIQYRELDKLAKQENWEEYRGLPANEIAQQTLMLLEKNWKSFFRSIKAWKKNPGKFTGMPKLPKYKHKTKGRSIAIFTQARLKEGYVHFHRKADIKPIKTKVDNLRQVRIVPQGNKVFAVEIIYEKEVKIDENLDSSLYLGVDLGVNNLAALTSNKQDLKSLLINGRPLKSINQFYNKKKAKLMSYVGGKGTSNRIEKLTHKRNCKVHDYMHKTSRFVINYCLEHHVKTIVVGKNNGWKNKISIGKRNNQTFVQIPFGKLIHQLEYKAEEVGIDVVCQEESYTSKASFLDRNRIPTYGVKHALVHRFTGKRIKRGLYKSRQGKLINADVNASLNILRKVIPKLFDRIEGLALNPVKVSLGGFNEIS